MLLGSPLQSFAGGDLESTNQILKTISGTITSAEDGEALIGGSVLVKGISRGLLTGQDGSYSIEAEAEDVLIFSYVGFQRQEIPVGNQNRIDVVLEVDYAQLDEVVVVGYGQQKTRIMSFLFTIR